MPNHQAHQNQMMFHLEAASAHAEELRDTRAQEIIDHARNMIERRPTEKQRSEKQ
jgi:hypothetical protein